ncbi:MAG: Nudix family hydrolase [Betaproteobacteria bacterium]|nr:Nudix family hydrolase [Betaproteobacteria bacterium]
MFEQKNHLNPETVDVAAGVIIRFDGRFLLGRRAPGSFYPGYWEFPGGKVEPGESPAGALCRELDEELGLQAERLYPWLVRTHDYEHAHVRLHFFEVAQWQGKIRACIHDALAWALPDGLDAPAPMLPANGPILKALALPRRMGITHAATIGVEPQLVALEHALQTGLRLVLIRESALPVHKRQAFTKEAVRRAHAAGALTIVNGKPELAQEAGADGLHLTSAQLMAANSRPDFTWVGASCHIRAELEHAAAMGLDYALLGAVKRTATHPGGETLGWEGFATLASGLPLPVFALGGLNDDDMETARLSGAHGIAAIRSIWSSAEN